MLVQSVVFASSDAESITQIDNFTCQVAVPFDRRAVHITITPTLSDGSSNYTIDKDNISWWVTISGNVVTADVDIPTLGGTYPQNFSIHTTGGITTCTINVVVPMGDEETK